jgi:1,4-dihydroxy-2-naphthoate octaprenyltransferase
MRPRSLLVAISPVLVGGTLGFARTGSIDPWPRCWCWGACAADAGHHQHAERRRLHRARRRTQRHAHRPAARHRQRLAQRAPRARRHRRRALLATVLGLALVAYRGWPVLAIGVASLLAALAYMGGPRPIAYTPFGELTVFVFFGLVAVMGTDWVLTGSSSLATVLASAIGCWPPPRWPSTTTATSPTTAWWGAAPLRSRSATAGSVALYSWLLLAPFVLLPVMAAVMASLAPCCPCCCCRGRCSCDAILCAAHEGCRSTRCCSAPSDWSCGLRWPAVRRGAAVPHAGLIMHDRSFEMRRRRVMTVDGWALPAGRRGGHGGRALSAAPVRIVVPYSVGVGPDVVARALAEELSPLWGQPVLVDNKPGASGIVAFGDMRRTPADGHTAVPGRHRHAGRQPAAARLAALRPAARPGAADAAVPRHLRAVGGGATASQPRPTCCRLRASAPTA